MLQYNIDVAIICETWFNEKIDSNIVSINGYKLFRKDRRKRKGGGVCVYIRNDVQAELIWPTELSDPNIEIIVLKCLFRLQTYFIISCYHLPKPIYSPDLINAAIDSIFDIICCYKDDSAVIIFAGDINCLDDRILCDEHGLTQMVATPTHENNILDKFFVNRPDLYNNCFTIKSAVKTKHLAVIAQNGFVSHKRIFKHRKVLLFDTRSHNIDKLRYFVATYDWSSLLQCTDIRLVYTRFLAVCKYLINACIPSRTVTLRCNDPYYITPFIKYLLRKRYRLRSKGRLDEANALAQKINETIANIRSKRLGNLHNASSKLLWSSVLPKVRDSANSNFSHLLTDMDNVCAYFANVSFDPQYDVQNVVRFSSLPDHVHAGQYLTHAEVSSFSVERMLRAVRSTSPGIDDLPCWFFQLCSVELADIVCHIFNSSITSGTVPTQWSNALITLIPKIPNPIQLNDLRPISVTPILSRLVEKLITRTWLRPAIPTSDIADQFAFRPSGSTTAALVYLMHHVTKLLENNNYVRCLMIDFSKAFDIVDHAIIVDKLSKLPLPWYVINWIISFLSGRKIIIKNGDAFSQPRPINKSIVQGSGIGPTLYILQESDLHPLSSINFILKYADDTNLLVPEHTDISFVREFENIKNWTERNKMIINISKTKEIVFQRPNPHHFLSPFPIDDIDQVHEAKLLGVILNYRFIFDSHIQFILRQCSQRMYLIKLLRNQRLPSNQLSIVFRALIISRIQYAISAWGGFIHSDWKSKIDAFLHRAHRAGFCQDFTFDSLLFAADQTFFRSISNSEHCLHSIIPAVKDLHYTLRDRGHDISLPEYTSILHKNSFLLRYLYKMV